MTENQDEWKELRREYEDQEIARFLDVFRLYVNEVRLPSSPIIDPLVVDTFRDDDDDGGGGAVAGSDEWIAVHQPVKASATASTASLPNTTFTKIPEGLAEIIAFNYVIPNLPEAGLPPKPPFTFGRFRLSLQRLYLAMMRTYWPVLKHTFHLALWKDKPKSTIYCAAYWILWGFDVILPAALFCILYALVRRRIFPYPSIRELKEHKQQLQAADQFSSEVSSRLTASSTFGIKEMWRVFRVVTHTPKRRPTNASTKGKGIASPPPESETLDEPSSATILDSAEETPEELDFKRDALYLLDQFIDLNERIINIFIWRRPNASRLFGAILFVMFLGTLILPAQYVAKAIYLTLGFGFWHVVPVIAALPPSQRSRLPPPFYQAPTDAEYAMELISRRVAAGQPLFPPKRQRQQSRSNADDAESPTTLGSSSSKTSGIDWKKVNDKVAMGKQWAEDGKRLLSGKKWQDSGTWPPRAPLVPPAVAIAQPGSVGENYSFPVTHSSSPGLLTITPTSISFTQIMQWSPKFTIPVNDLRAVKKTGLLKGLSILWHDRNTGEDREEKFKLVANRDELFARLVGSNESRRWLKS
ncbi:hypothetical protein DL96DRAFT_1573471 [Flagelloscypha sp. PMI_526]|nr:hypothetical protein DL96DRAFT_1573471 [Flagelloscypha sp. PMI_526]